MNRGEPHRAEGLSSLDMGERSCESIDAHLLLARNNSAASVFELNRSGIVGSVVSRLR